MFETSPRRLPAGLLGMLAIALLVELVIGTHLKAVTFIHAYQWKRASDAVAKAADFDVLIFGDSLVKNGVIPPVAQARMAPGVRMFNFSASGAPPMAEYFLFKRCLDVRGGVPPRAIVVDGECLEQDGVKYDQRWSVWLRYGEILDLGLTSRRLGFFTATMIARTIPSVHAAPQIRRRLMQALRNEPWMETASLAVFERNWKRNGGGEVLASGTYPTGSDPRPAQLEREHYWPTGWKVDPINLAYMRRLLDLAASHQVPVYWLIPPAHPSVEDRREKSGRSAKVRACLRSLQERYPNLYVIDAHDAGYPAEALFDMTHLNRLGAIAYSDALGVVLRDQLARGSDSTSDRWIPLPRYDKTAAESLANASDVEDTKTSGRNLARAMDEVKGRQAARPIDGAARRR